MSALFSVAAQPAVGVETGRRREKTTLMVLMMTVVGMMLTADSVVVITSIIIIIIIAARQTHLDPRVNIVDMAAGPSSC